MADNLSDPKPAEHICRCDYMPSDGIGGFRNLKCYSHDAILYTSATVEGLRAELAEARERIKHFEADRYFYLHGTRITVPGRELVSFAEYKCQALTKVVAERDTLRADLKRAQDAAEASTALCSGLRAELEKWRAIAPRLDQQSETYRAERLAEQRAPASPPPDSIPLANYQALQAHLATVDMRLGKLEADVRNLDSIVLDGVEAIPMADELTRLRAVEKAARAQITRVWPNLQTVILEAQQYPAAQLACELYAALGDLHLDKGVWKVKEEGSENPNHG